MTMSIGQLIDYCQQSYNSAVGDNFFPPAWYITTIWRGETELAEQGWVIERTYSTSSVTGSRELAWPSNTYAIREVRYKNRALKKVTLKDDPRNDLVDPTGEPYTYAIWDNTVILFPTPDKDDDTIQLRCYIAPSQLLASSDPLNVPDEYQIQLVDFVLAHMAIKDQNLSLGEAYLTKWEQAVERARQQRRRRERADKNMVVKDTYFSGDFSQVGVFNGWNI